jgi:ABC-type glycerol-3-phosphate transport system permease component
MIMARASAFRAFRISPLLLLAWAPLAWMVWLAVRVPQGEALTLGLGNFSDLLGSGPFLRYTLNSAIVAAWVVGLNLLFASLVGYALARGRFRGKRPLLFSILITLMVPRQVTMIPVYLMAARMHMIDTYPALIAPFAVDAFNIFLMRQYMQQIPPEMEDAARVDGASELRIFFQVVMPMVRPALAVMGVNTFLVNWNSFLYPLVLTNSDAMRTLPVGLALYAQGEHSVDWGHLMAGALIGTLPVLAAFLAFQKQIVEGILAGTGK